MRTAMKQERYDKNMTALILIQQGGFIYSHGCDHKWEQNKKTEFHVRVAGIRAHRVTEQVR